MFVLAFVVRSFAGADQLKSGSELNKIQDKFCFPTYKVKEDIFVRLILYQSTPTTTREPTDYLYLSPCVVCAHPELQRVNGKCVRATLPWTIGLPVLSSEPE